MSIAFPIVVPGRSINTSREIGSTLQMTRKQATFAEPLAEMKAQMLDCW